ncbi:MAG: hypothetical protein IJK52_05720 [Oscillospiraceae bacterium]|nr:hypothetical protein [Oscillospiraceae bacterium]
MFIERISADWKDGSGGVLELKDGFNLLKADGRDWSGALRGTLCGADADFARAEIVCRTPERTLTLSRENGEWRASDENGVAEDLTAENCAEVLTGVGGDVYETLAFLSGTEAADWRERVETEQARLKELEEREADLNKRVRDLETEQAEMPDLSVLTAAYEAMKGKLEEDHVPEMDTISRLRGAIINIMTAGRQLDKAEAEQEAAEKILSDAKADVDAAPFAGMTPDEAEESPLKLPWKPVIPQWLSIGFCAVAALGALFLFRSPGAWYPVLWILFVGLGVGAGWLSNKWAERWEIVAAERRDRREADLVQYAELYRIMEEAQAAADIKIAAADSLRESLTTNERGILREINRFAPEVSTMQEADAQLRLCAKRRKELSIAEAVVRKAKALEDGSAAVPAIAVVNERNVILTPSGDGTHDELARTLQTTHDERTALRLEIRRDQRELSEESERTSESVRRALDTLKRSETDLSERFADDVSERISALFGVLTDKQYEDENMFTPGSVAALLAGPGPDALKASPHLLAPFRLAVCLTCFERVLSGESRPPLVLRDPLRGLNERSRAASMRFLKSMAENRQILFFER